jgi:hypothetical protein
MARRKYRGMANFIAELKQRPIYRVAIAYCALIGAIALDAAGKTRRS